MLESKISLDGVPVLQGAGVVSPNVLDGVAAVTLEDDSTPQGSITRSMNVAVVGTGYVGLVTGAILADQGSSVLCVDLDESKLAMINKGVSPIYEPGLDQIIEANIRSGRLKTTTDIAAATEFADVLFIAVGTPPSTDGTPDLTAVLQVVRSIAPNIKKHVTVVTKSTVPVGTGDLIERTFTSLGVDPALVDVVSNPEFLREGSAVYDTLNPDRIVIGIKRRGAETKLLELYGTYGCQILVTKRRSSEMIKYASNSFLALKISYINAVSRICELSGADVSEVSRGMGLDKRIGTDFLNAGLGWGGSCFPKDVQGLMKTAETVGYDFDILQAADRVNNDQTKHFLRRLHRKLGDLENKTVTLLGLAFKPNTDDIRDAKSLEIIGYLKEHGAKIKAYDPVATDNMRAVHPDLDYATKPMDAVVNADAVILVTEWAEFKFMDLRRMAELCHQPVLFDGRRAIRREDAVAAGFEYFTIGA